MSENPAKEKEAKKVGQERDWNSSDEFETLAYICQENSGLKARILDRIRAKYGTKEAEKAGLLKDDKE